MAAVKCIRCKKLIRWIMRTKDGDLVVYSCRKLPYSTVLGGLFRPGMGTLKAVEDCPEPANDCVICGRTEDLTTFAFDIRMCELHNQEWSAWLTSQPGIWDYIRPKGRTIHSRWWEKFREFVESKRTCTVCGCTWANACQTPDGPCSWVEWNLCSGCKPKEPEGAGV